MRSIRYIACYKHRAVLLAFKLSINYESTLHWRRNENSDFAFVAAFYS